MRRSFVVALFSTAGLISSCTGATTRFYTLEPGPPRPVQAYAGAPFRVDAVHIPASLDRPELVRDAADGRFTVSDNDHWAAPVGELLRRVLTQDLAPQLPMGTVVYPDAPKPPGSAGLVVDILSISSAGGRMTMDASWTLIPAQGAPGSPAVDVQQHALRLTTAMGEGVRGNATALSAMTDQMAVAIAESLSRSGT